MPRLYQRFGVDKLFVNLLRTLLNRKVCTGLECVLFSIKGNEGIMLADVGLNLFALFKQDNSFNSSAAFSLTE